MLRDCHKIVDIDYHDHEDEDVANNGEREILGGDNGEADDTGEEDKGEGEDDGEGDNGSDDKFHDFR